MGVDLACERLYIYFTALIMVKNYEQNSKVNVIIIRTNPLSALWSKSLFDVWNIFIKWIVAEYMHFQIQKV